MEVKVNILPVTNKVALFKDSKEKEFWLEKVEFLQFITYVPTKEEQEEDKDTDLIIKPITTVTIMDGFDYEQLSNISVFDNNTPALDLKMKELKNEGYRRLGV
jgi:hypothetical protein